MLANVSLVGLVGCGGEPAAATVVVAGGVHPDAMPDAGAGSELTAAERDLLARARGREWPAWSAADVDRFLRPGGDTSRVLAMWDPVRDPGAAALTDLADVTDELAAEGAEVVIAVYEGGDARGELIALRESQTAVAVARIPRGGHAAEGLPGGEALAVEGAGAAPRRVPLGDLGE